MRIAALYDIHGNFPALEAVLQEVEQAQPDLIVIGGDVASGPMPRATVERLMKLGDSTCFIRGNADREVVDYFDGISPALDMTFDVQKITAWTAGQLERYHRDFLASFKEHVTFPVRGLGNVLFCHATPRNDTEIFTVVTPEEQVQPIFKGVEADIVVCGHTHMQFTRYVNNIQVVNAGSVGMPYVSDPGAYWLLLDNQNVRLHRTLYDVEQAAKLIKESGYPQAQDFADNNVLHPPTAEEATAIFEQIAAKQNNRRSGKA